MPIYLKSGLIYIHDIVNKNGIKPVEWFQGRQMKRPLALSIF
jgi:hypothetical protein